MKKIISTAAQLAALVSLALVGVAHADQAGSPPFKAFAPIGKSAQPDNYLGASLGSTKADGFCTGVQNCNASGNSWKAFAGVRMNENIVLEGGYVNFGKQQGQDANGATNQKASAFTAAGVLTHPLGQQIEVFGKAGAARWKADQTNSTGNTSSKGTGLLVGAGANYDLGDNMGIRAEWERYKDVGSAAGKPGGLDLLSVGVTFSSL